MKTLTDWFDRVYIINCANRSDRRERVLAELKESGMADTEKVIIYPGIIGDWVNHPAGWGGGRGAWGCLQSHRRIMEDVMHVRDDRDVMVLESVLILEDDVYFIGNALSALNEFMPLVPDDWGQIYLGGQHQQPVSSTGIPGLMRGVSVNRTHAYAINTAYISRIYCHVSYAPDYAGTKKHIDHQLELAHRRKDWPVYCPEMWIVGQEAGQSNVSGRINERKIWQ